MVTAAAAAVVAPEPSPDHEMLHEMSAFFAVPEAQRPTYVRLRSASAPIDENDAEAAPQRLQ